MIINFKFEIIAIKFITIRSFLIWINCNNLLKVGNFQIGIILKLLEILYFI